MPTGEEQDRPSLEADGLPLPDDHPLTEPDSSLYEDVSALISDGKTYLTAEVQFQKSRARHSGAELGRIAGFGAIAAIFVLLSLIGLTVGSIISLSPVVGPWLATAIVVAVLLVLAGIFGLAARGHVKKLKQGFGGSPS